MTDDIDIYRTANVLVELHGEDAPIQAAMKADALLEAGDIDGVAAWKRIRAAVDELLAKDKPEGVGGHYPRSALAPKADLQAKMAKLPLLALSSH